MGASFNPATWLQALTQIGGAYALMAGRKLCFAVEGCDADALAGVMEQIVGHPDRQEQVKRAIEQHQCGEAV
jgi:hypothetical protein